MTTTLDYPYPPRVLTASEREQGAQIMVAYDPASTSWQALHLARHEANPWERTALMVEGLYALLERKGIDPNVCEWWVCV